MEDTPSSIRNPESIVLKLVTLIEACCEYMNQQPPRPCTLVPFVGLILMLKRSIGSLGPLHRAMTVRHWLANSVRGGSRALGPKVRSSKSGHVRTLSSGRDVFENDQSSSERMARSIAAMHGAEGGRVSEMLLVWGNPGAETPAS